MLLLLIDPFKERGKLGSYNVHTTAALLRIHRCKELKTKRKIRTNLTYLRYQHALHTRFNYFY